MKIGTTFCHNISTKTMTRPLSVIPFINNNIQITRIEVWVTNRSNRTENVRNVVAYFKI